MKNTITSILLLLALLLFSGCDNREEFTGTVQSFSPEGRVLASKTVVLLDNRQGYQIVYRENYWVTGERVKVLKESPFYAAKITGEAEAQSKVNKTIKSLRKDKLCPRK